MLGSATLEVALGLTFIYLTLSLVCSGLSEYYSSLLRRRPAHLRDAISYLFNKDAPRGAKFLAHFFDHPMIKGLTPANLGFSFAKASRQELAAVDPRGINKELRRSRRRTPQYISDETFAKVVLDILGRGRETFAAIPPAAGAGGAAGAGDLPNPASGDDSPVPPSVQTAAPAALRDIAATLPDGPVKDGLRPTLEAQATALEAQAGATSEAFWARVVASYRAIREAATAFAASPDKPALDAALDQARARLREIREAQIHIRQLGQGLDATMTALGGALQLLPDDEARRGLQALFDRGRQDFEAASRVAATAQSAWDSLSAMLERLRGSVALLPQGEKTTGLIRLIDQERKRLADLNGNVLTLEKIRDAVEMLPDSEIRQTLEALMGTADLTLDQVEEDIAGWYNETMDRVSGWYKRNTQLILALIALGVSVGLNADSLRIANALIRDPALRAAVAEAARDQINAKQRLTETTTAAAPDEMSRTATELKSATERRDEAAESLAKLANARGGAAAKKRTAEGDAAAKRKAAENAEASLKAAEGDLAAKRSAEAEAAKAKDAAAKDADDKDAAAGKAAKESEDIAKDATKDEAAKKAAADAVEQTKTAARSAAEKKDQAERDEAAARDVTKRAVETRDSAAKTTAEQKEAAGRADAALTLADGDLAKAEAAVKAATEERRKADDDVSAKQAAAREAESKKSAATPAAAGGADTEQALESPALPEAIRKQLDELKIPLGWDETEVDRLRSLFAKDSKSGWQAGLNKLLGLALTALALSMGAPFWFDILNKIVNIRTAGKAPEAKAEESKKSA